MSVNPEALRLFYVFDHLDWKSRMPLARAAQQAGYNVTIGIVGTESQELVQELAGFTILQLPKPQNKFGPFSVLSTVRAIRRAVLGVHPHLLHTVTLKYSFLLGLACTRVHGFRIIYTIAGLGFLFRSEGLKPKLMRGLLSPFLKFVLKDIRAELIFQNPDDRDLLVNMGYARLSQTHLVISSGVDLERFSARPESESTIPLALMPTRLVHEKGVSIFVEAARILHKKGIQARYQIAGGLTSHNPRAITEAQMQDLTRDGVVEWLGRVDDMPGLLEQAAIIVYPSYYGEGVPRVSLEAIAAGRPIITTDHAGCREVVHEGKNGILVPIKDIQATAAAMEKLLTDPALRHKMGEASRKLAEDKFDVKAITAQTLALYEHALSWRGGF